MIFSHFSIIRNAKITEIITYMKIDFQRTAKFHFICMNLGKLFTNQFVSSFSKEECNSLNKFHFCNFRQNRSITERVIVRFYPHP